MTCTAPDCERAAARDGLCWGHLKQRQRGRRLTPLRERYESPWVRLVAAMEAYENADSDEAFERAKDRCRKAAKAFVDSLNAPPRVSCRLRRDGIWECRVRAYGRRLSFYGHTEAEARAKVSTPAGT